MSSLEQDTHSGPCPEYVHLYNGRKWRSVVHLYLQSSEDKVVDVWRDEDVSKEVEEVEWREGKRARESESVKEMRRRRRRWRRRRRRMRREAKAFGQSQDRLQMLSPSLPLSILTSLFAVPLSLFSLHVSSISLFHTLSCFSLICPASSLSLSLLLILPQRRTNVGQWRSEVKGRHAHSDLHRVQ